MKYLCSEAKWRRRPTQFRSSFTRTRDRVMMNGVQYNLGDSWNRKFLRISIARHSIRKASTLCISIIQWKMAFWDRPRLRFFSNPVGFARDTSRAEWYRLGWIGLDALDRTGPYMCVQTVRPDPRIEQLFVLNRGHTIYAVESRCGTDTGEMHRTRCWWTLNYIHMFLCCLV